MRVEREGGAVAWLAGTLAEPSVQGQSLPPRQELRPCQSFLKPLVASEGLFGQSFSAVQPGQAPRGIPCLGSFSVVLHVRHIEGPP